MLQFFSIHMLTSCYLFYFSEICQNVKKGFCNCFNGDYETSKAIIFTVDERDGRTLFS